MIRAMLVLFAASLALGLLRKRFPRLARRLRLLTTAAVFGAVVSAAGLLAWGVIFALLDWLAPSWFGSLYAVSGRHSGLVFLAMAWGAAIAWLMLRDTPEMLNLD